MNCLLCDKELSGGPDTFGSIGQEVCLGCWLEHGDDLDMPKTWYGLGPHEHNYDAEGQIIIGGTRFLPLPEPVNGEYIINGLHFRPDPEAPGCGVWSR